MFSYTHVPPGIFGYEASASFYTSLFETYLATSNTAVTDTVSFIQSGSRTEHSKRSHGYVSYSFSENDNFGRYNDLTEVTSYETSYPISVTQITASRSWGETWNDEFRSPISGAYSSSTTLTFQVSHSSTAVGSITYTVPQTSTSIFTQIFRSIGTSTLLGTASATTTNTQTQTLTLSNATTLAPILALELPKLERWFVARENPPGLRRAALAFAATHTGTSVIASLSAGSHSYRTDFESSSISSTDGYTFNSTEVNSAGGATVNDLEGSTTTYFAARSPSSTGWTATDVLSAVRRALPGPAFVSQTEIGSAITFSPSIAATWTGGVSVAQGIQSANIFTNARVHASTTFRWKYESSSWRLHATSSNSATTSSYTVAAGVSGLASTDTSPAFQIIGVTTAILGPAHPFTALSLNELSVSTLLSDTSGVSAYYSSRNASSAGSFSTLVTASSSATTQLGSGSGFAPATFADSLLTWAVAQVAASVQTATWSSYIDGEGSIPSIFRASKWNEASRGDPVSVDQ